MHLVYSPLYSIDIGPHVFLTEKYRRVHDSVLREGIASSAQIAVPEAASWDDLARAHDKAYLEKLRNGTLTDSEIATLELPWSSAMVDGFRVMVGGSILAARQALQDGVGFHIGGGLHHGFSGHGEGFCVFNDVAVALRTLMADGRIQRAAVIDLDVHHGNGTAAIFARELAVFTFSMHQQHNYPPFKPASTLDIGLPDRMTDESYLAKLEKTLPSVMAHQPDLVFYLAGADPYERDQLGGLSLTKEGLRRRDRIVLETVRRAGVPIAVVLAGGYAEKLADTVAIHTASVEEAVAISRTGTNAG